MQLYSIEFFTRSFICQVVINFSKEKTRKQLTMEAIPSAGVTQTAENTGALDNDQGISEAKNEG